MLDLRFRVGETQPHQDGGCRDPGIEALQAELLEAEHAPVEAYVARIDLDQQIGAIVHPPCIDEREVEQRGQQRSRPDVVVDRQLGEFAQPFAVAAQGVGFVRVQVVDEQARAHVEPDRDGPYDAVMAVRRERDTVRIVASGLAELVVAPGIAALDQAIGGVSSVVGVGQAQLEPLARRFPLQLPGVRIFDAEVDRYWSLCDGSDGVAAESFFDQLLSCR